MSASEVQKTKYSDLLALAEDFDDMKNTRVLRGRRTRDTSSSVKASKPKKEETESDASSSEEEDIKPKPKKRKKGVIAVEDDSD